MGIEPFLVASSLLANMAQRLVRRLCSDCRVAYTPTEIELAEVSLTPAMLAEHGGVIYRPGGCEECLGSGYRGRLGIFELLQVTDEIRTLVMQRANASQIKRIAVEQGMIPLRQDGGLKVAAGLTSIEEVFRVTQEDTA